MKEYKTTILGPLYLLKYKAEFYKKRLDWYIGVIERYNPKDGIFLDHIKRNMAINERLYKEFARAYDMLLIAERITK